MLADEVGIGVDFIYNSYMPIDIQLNLLTNSLGSPVTYNYDWKMERVRIHLRLNYHFTQTENVDNYFGVGVEVTTDFILQKVMIPIGMTQVVKDL